MVVFQSGVVSHQGVPQGSVLGPTCFLIFINDLDEVISLVDGFIYKFADDTKCGRTIVDDSDRMIMQENINQLMRWAETWQMEFNGKKCKIMHLGKSNPCFHYTMGGFAPAGIVLETVSEEKDLGVIVHDSLKPSHQCAKAAKKANSVLGQMRKAFQYRDKCTWLNLYVTYVRPHLECSVQAWSPWLKKDVEMLEKVQMRALKMVRGLQGRTYEERLREVGLTTLSARRQRGDMVQVWKFVHKKSIMDPKTFTMVGVGHPQHTRHTAKPMNIINPHSKLEIRKNFFTVRAVNQWNQLPAKLQNAEDMLKFEIGYDEYLSTVR